MSKPNALATSLNSLSSRLRDFDFSSISSDQRKQYTTLALLNTLGYNVTDFTEVTLGFSFGADPVITADYAVYVDSRPEILIFFNPTLTSSSVIAPILNKTLSQTTATFLVETDGLLYRFYTDRKGASSSTPFFSFDLRTLSDQELEYLLAYAKGNFNASKILDEISTILDFEKIIGLMRSDFENPSEDFIKLYLQTMPFSKLTKGVIRSYAPIVKKALDSLISEKVSHLVGHSNAETKTAPTTKRSELREPQPVELEAFKVVKRLLKSVLPDFELSIKCVKSYAYFCYKDTSTLWVARLHVSPNGILSFVVRNDSIEKGYELFRISSVAGIKTDPAIVDCLKEHALATMFRFLPKSGSTTGNSQSSSVETSPADGTSRFEQGVLPLESSSSTPEDTTELNQ